MTVITEKEIKKVNCNVYDNSVDILKILQEIMEKMLVIYMKYVKVQIE